MSVVEYLNNAAPAYLRFSQFNAPSHWALRPGEIQIAVHDAGKLDSIFQGHPQGAVRECKRLIRLAIRRSANVSE
jgi:hypothetical protein